MKSELILSRFNYISHIYIEKPYIYTQDISFSKYIHIELIKKDINFTF